MLSFTQIQHFHGGYTLRDPYKDLVRIRSGWIPFCTCCLERTSGTMSITDLDGTNSGSIFFEKSHSDFDGSTLSLNFIPNLNPKAKYMLLAASIQLVSFLYFRYVNLSLISLPLFRYAVTLANRDRNARVVVLVFYAIFALILLIVGAVTVLCV